MLVEVNTKQELKMTTDDLTRTIKKFTAENGRGPNSIDELQGALASELHTSVSDADVMEELRKAVEVGIVGTDGNGCFVVL